MANDGYVHGVRCSGDSCTCLPKPAYLDGEVQRQQDGYSKVVVYGRVRLRELEGRRVRIVVEAIA